MGTLEKTHISSTERAQHGGHGSRHSEGTGRSKFFSIQPIPLDACGHPNAPESLEVLAGDVHAGGRYPDEKNMPETFNAVALVRGVKSEKVLVGVIAWSE